MTRITTANLNAYSDLVRELLPALQAAAVGYLEAFRNELTPYPSSSEANSPNARGRWYERGYGPKWTRKDGSTGGRKTSQMLGRSWSVAPTGGGAHLWSRAGYSAIVHRDPASDLRPRQAGVHGRRGWVDTGTAYRALEAKRTWPRLVVTACRHALGR
jgi:hypothetical protein